LSFLIKLVQTVRYFIVQFERQKTNLHGNRNMQTLFWNLVNISAKYRQHWSS